MDGKRHLPVLRAAADEGEPERPPWQWIALGGVTTLAVWLPLAAFVGSVFAGSADRVAPAAAHVVAEGLGGFAGGVLVGRFGGAGVGAREATLGAVVAAAGACAMVLVQPGAAAVAGVVALAVVVALVLGIAAAGGRAGAALGRRLRIRAGEPVAKPVEAQRSSRDDGRGGSQGG